MASCAWVIWMTHWVGHCFAERGYRRVPNFAHSRWNLRPPVPGTHRASRCRSCNHRAVGGRRSGGWIAETVCGRPLQPGLHPCQHSQNGWGGWTPFTIVFHEVSLCIEESIIACILVGDDCHNCLRRMGFFLVLLCSASAPTPLPHALLQEGVIPSIIHLLKTGDIQCVKVGEQHPFVCSKRLVSIFETRKTTKGFRNVWASSLEHSCTIEQTLHFFFHSDRTLVFHLDGSTVARRCAW